MNGAVKIGPTAIPAFWREHYQGLSRFNPNEMAEILWREAGLFCQSDFDFRRLAITELRKYHRPTLAAHASELVSGMNASDYKTWGKPGIRAQLFNINSRKLEMDFVIEGDERSIHVLNAVSPAFTCSMPFAKHVVDLISKNL